MRVLITGAAGFIGAHLAARLLRLGHKVVGLDNFSPYYDACLKRRRLAALPGAGAADGSWSFNECDICAPEALRSVFAAARPDCVVHLAAQPGIRHSIDNPLQCQQVNVAGFVNVLECCRQAHPRPRLVYASSSSVYGAEGELPFSESAPADRPLSPYAAAKRANELMAHASAQVHGLTAAGLRLFTVYGPWGRPDMAVWQFAAALAQGRALRIFGSGRQLRDFTYIDDAVAGLIGCIMSDNLIGHMVFNLGGGRPAPLLEMARLLGRALGTEPRFEFARTQPGDMPATWADISKLHDFCGYIPATPLAQGLVNFAEWFKEYHDSHALDCL